MSWHQVVDVSQAPLHMSINPHPLSSHTEAICLHSNVYLGNMPSFLLLWCLFGYQISYSSNMPSVICYQICIIKMQYLFSTRQQYALSGYSSVCPSMRYQQYTPCHVCSSIFTCCDYWMCTIDHHITLSILSSTFGLAHILSQYILHPL